MPPSVPAVEISDHGDALRVWRPDGEADATSIFHSGFRRPEPLGQMPMRALGKKMQVQIAQDQSEGIGILRLLECVRPMDAQDIALCSSYRAAEQSIAHACQSPKKF